MVWDEDFGETVEVESVVSGWRMAMHGYVGK